MSQFLPVSSQQAGLDLSRALYDVAHPPAARLPSDVTTHFCGVVEDVTGQWWLEIPVKWKKKMTTSIQEKPSSRPQ